MIGCRKNIEHPAENGKPAYTENVDVEGFSPQGFAKLKKSRHVVIPEGIQAIHENAFIGRSSGKPDNFIDTLVLPKSLKVIENGAFAYNTIRGTVEIPEGVISIGAVAFIGNKIEKVVFKSVLNGTGKINPTDTKPYYLSGVGSRAFQANKIREIVVPGNLGDFMFLFDETNPNQPDPGPFDNQNLGTKTIEVGEAFEYPIAIHQSGNNQEDIHGYGGFIENSTPTLITKSSYFELKNGKYVAKTAGTIQGQWIEYDLRNSENSPIGAAIFKYEILSKGSLCTVTFNNGDKVISTIRVKKGQSVTKGVVNYGQMPVDPVKDGYKFTGWYTQKDGKGNQFTTDTVVNADTTVYASYASKTPKPPTPAANATPTLTLQDKTITEGEQLDLKTLVVSAKDPEDGDITSKVKLTDNGGFDNTKVGSYKITFSVTDNGGATATASATVTVTKKPTPPTPPTPPEPEPTPVPELEQELEPEPAPDQPDQPEQPKQPEAKHAAKHLPQTGSDTMPILASAIASLFAGIAGLAKSFSATRKRRN